ncbi:hypothetical protein BaRGS_00037982 [Batillaria attramentaria]|uniref:Uncharacterized protein n=1 Tax=Batillaria attramentaria TaxID=370345 RepID=A0ABD0J7J1_9CAEN
MSRRSFKHRLFSLSIPVFPRHTRQSQNKDSISALRSQFSVLEELPPPAATLSQTAPELVTRLSRLTESLLNYRQRRLPPVTRLKDMPEQTSKRRRSLLTKVVPRGQYD